MTERRKEPAAGITTLTGTMDPALQRLAMMPVAMVMARRSRLFAVAPAGAGRVGWSSKDPMPLPMTTPDHRLEMRQVSRAPAARPR
jgi:hypothetical protein